MFLKLSLKILSKLLFVLKTREYASGMICKSVTVSHIFINSSSPLPHILRNPSGFLAWLEHSTGIAEVRIRIPVSRNFQAFFSQL